jgi:hypothetical protein
MQTVSRFSRPLARRVGLLGVIAGLLALVVGAAPRIGTHPTGTLTLASRNLRAGDSVAIAGNRFAPNDEVTIVLVGVAGRLELGAVPTDSAGAFQRIFVVPASASEGQYRLVAEAIDGDPVASVDVVIQRAAAASPMGTMQGGAAQGVATQGGATQGAAPPEGMPMAAHPSGEALPLVHAASLAVTWFARLFVVACVLAGAVLLWPGSRSRIAEDDQ